MRETSSVSLLDYPKDLINVWRDKLKIRKSQIRRGGGRPPPDKIPISEKLPLKSVKSKRGTK